MQASRAFRWPWSTKPPLLRRLLQNGNQARVLLASGVASSHHSRVQVWVSSFGGDPFLNLAVEQYLLETSHPQSTLLFLYQNNPCVVIGRSQNPWMEANLPRLRAGLPPSNVGGARGLFGDHPPKGDGDSETHPVPIHLVRRRSGGGTVFHDWGNVNYSVIFPTDAFDRDVHAEMVARALRDGMGVPGVRVNERHDIVMDGHLPGSASTPASTPASTETKATTPPPPTFKISGSAYRVTRLRSMHHGTCLLASPYLTEIGPLLRSPAEPFLSSRGVGSVRSPVRNAVDTRREGGRAPRALIPIVQDFIYHVIKTFWDKYPTTEGPAFIAQVGSDALEIPEVAKIYEELKSPEWIYGQSPQFTFSTHPTEADLRERPPLPAGLPPEFRATLTVRHGKIKECNITGLSGDAAADQALRERLLGQSLHAIGDWRVTLQDATRISQQHTMAVGRWFNTMLGCKRQSDDLFIPPKS